MKYLFAFVLCLSVSAAPISVPVNLSWQDTNNIPVLPQYVPGSNDCYVVVWTNAITQVPANQWPVLTVFTNWTLGTNGTQIWYTNQVNLAPGINFVAIVTSNFWGSAAIPSNVAQTGPASTPTLNLNLSR